jgi:predicted lipid-binding transport protein (Tim44 family)
VPADILLYGLVAAGLVFWLRNILGTRHGDENQRSNPFAEITDTPAKKKNTPDGARAFMGEPTEDLPSKLDRNVEIVGASVQDGLNEIERLDRSFDLAEFTKGAQDAFVIIVEAFADRDKDTLENLLSPPLFKAFSGVIDEREKNGETASVEIHAVRKVDVLDASVNGKMAQIIVRFVADETSILRDKKDKLIFGDPERVTETRDIWTFGRDIRSRDPKWILMATREDEGDEQAGSTVPESDAGKTKKTK